MSAPGTKKEEVDITEVGLTDLNSEEYEELMDLKDRYRTDVNGMGEEEKKRFLNLSTRVAVAQKDAKWAGMAARFSELDEMKLAIIAIERKVDKSTSHLESEVADVHESMKLLLQKMDQMGEALNAAAAGKQSEMKRETMSINTSSTSITHGANANRDKSHLIPWPVKTLMKMETEGKVFTWVTTEPKEANNLVKREQQSGSSKARNRMRELAVTVAAFSESHFLTGPVIIGIVRQCLTGDMTLREYLDTLMDHGLSEESVWYELQEHGEVQFTSSDAIREIQALIQTPQGVKLAEVNLKLPALVRLKHGYLGDSDEEKMKLVENTIDEMNQFLCINVISQMVAPLVEEKYRNIKQVIQRNKDLGLPVKDVLSAYCTFYNSLLDIPQLKNMEFKTKSQSARTSGVSDNDQKQQNFTRNQGRVDQRGGQPQHQAQTNMGYGNSTNQVQKQQQQPQGGAYNWSTSNSGRPYTSAMTFNSPPPQGPNQTNYGGQGQLNYGGQAHGGQNHGNYGGQGQGAHGGQGQAHGGQGNGNYGGQGQGAHGGQGQVQGTQGGHGQGHQGGTAQHGQGQQGGTAQHGQGQQIQDARGAPRGNGGNAEHGNQWDNMTPSKFPQDMSDRCWNCTDDDHRSRECQMYNGAYPLSPSDPANQCAICGGWHKAKCAMPGIWDQAKRQGRN
jgi:hypothetical protein